MEILKYDMVYTYAYVYAFVYVYVWMYDDHDDDGRRTTTTECVDGRPGGRADGRRPTTDSFGLRNVSYK